MVLLLKQWKSRSSPGFEASVVQEPIRNVSNAAVGDTLAAAFLSYRAKVPKPQASQGRMAARTPDLFRGRIAKLADASGGA